MCTITWESTHRRLRLAGCCEAPDREAVQDALAACEAGGRVLIVDLTAVTSLAPAVAEVVLSARDRSKGCRVSVLRRKGSAVEEVLAALEAR
jgi:hypothetical protein